MQRIKDMCIGAITALLIAGVLIGLLKFINKQSIAVPGETPAKFAKLPKETVPCEQVQALPAKAKKILNLPPAVIKDEQDRLIAVAQVPQVDYPQLAGALLNTKTGVGTIYFTPQPRPWVDFNRRLAIGAAYGIGEDGIEYKAYARWTLMHVKRLHFGVLAEVYDTGRAFAGGFGEFN